MLSIGGRRALTGNRCDFKALPPMALQLLMFGPRRAAPARNPIWSSEEIGAVQSCHDQTIPFFYPFLLFRFMGPGIGRFSSVKSDESVVHSARSDLQSHRCV